MPDFYDRLGELLKESLKSGNFFNNSKDTIETEILKNKSETTSELKHINSETINDNINQNTNKKIFIKSKKQQTGQVIKMYNYTENMHIPDDVQKAFCMLEIPFTTELKSIKKQYHELIKKAHPDTKTTIQNSQDVYFSIQKTPQMLKDAFETIENYIKSI